MGQKTVLFRAEGGEMNFPTSIGEIFKRHDIGQPDPITNAGEQVTKMLSSIISAPFKNLFSDRIAEALRVTDGWDKVKAQYDKGNRVCDRFGKAGQLTIEFPGFLLPDWNLCLSAKAAQEAGKDIAKTVVHMGSCYVDTALSDPFRLWVDTFTHAARGEAINFLNDVTQVVLGEGLLIAPNLLKIYNCVEERLAKDAGL